MDYTSGREGTVLLPGHSANTSYRTYTSDEDYGNRNGRSRADRENMAGVANTAFTEEEPYTDYENVGNVYIYEEVTSPLRQLPQDGSSAFMGEYIRPHTGPSSTAEAAALMAGHTWSPTGPLPSTEAARPTTATYNIPTRADSINWLDEIDSTCRTVQDSNLYERVLSRLREFPLSIQWKLFLSRKIRQKQDKDSRASRDSALNSGNHRKVSKRRKGFGWNSGGFVPFGVWNDRIHKIAAYFGTNVASYFRFLRFLALINLGIGLVMFIFVSLPQIVSLDPKSKEIKSGFFGELSNTIFFYGAYNDKEFAYGGNHLTYSQPLAYLLTWCCANVLTVFATVISMYVSYRRIKKMDEGDDVFSNQTFLSWDYSVTSNEGSKIRSSAITTHLKEMAREEKRKVRLSRQQRLKQLFLRLLCNCLTLAILAGSGAIIYYLADNSVTRGLDIPEVVGDFFEKYQLSFAVSALKVIIPPFLGMLLLLEKYHPRTQIKVQIARTAVFYAANLVAFLASIYSVSTKCMSYYNGTQTMACHSSSDEHYCCWENEVGEQLFQVVVLDLLVSLLMGLIIRGGRAALVKCCNFKKFGYADFEVAGLFLDLVYGQSLIWIGLYFAPFFALIGLVKLVILFYFNYSLARFCCVSPTKVFKASRSGTFYLFILLVTLLVCFFPMTYAIIQLVPSKCCGPFKTNVRVYEVLTDRIGESPAWIQDIVQFCSTPAVVVPLFLVFILLVLYYRARSSAHQMEAKDLRYHLQFERKVEKRRVFAQGVSTVNLLDTNKKGQGNARYN